MTRGHGPRGFYAVWHNTGADLRRIDDVPRGAVPLPAREASPPNGRSLRDFLLIAGTYTPLTLITLRGTWGWLLFGMIWGLALLGIVLRAWRVRGSRSGAAALYVAMGWLVVLAMRPLTRALPLGGLVLLICGGLAYTCGVRFYVCHRLRYHHAIWHGFVLLGSVLHFLVVALYLIPGAG